MKKIISLVACVALGVACMTAKAQPHLAGLGIASYPDRFVFSYTYDSATVLPVRVRITLTAGPNDTIVTDSVFTDHVRSDTHTLYVSPVPPPYTIYEATLYLVDTQTNSNVIYEPVETPGPNGILGPGRSMVYASGETLYVRDASGYVGTALVLYDMEGRQVKQVEIASASQTASLAGLPGGIYILTDGKGGTLKVPISR